jgi:hypothetical protein
LCVLTVSFIPLPLNIGLSTTSIQVYIVDKTENNPLQVDGHPAWASEITLMPNNSVRPMNVVSNSFCAGGNYLGDGRLLNVGGNQAITTGGNTPSGENNPAPTGAW